MSQKGGQPNCYSGFLSNSLEQLVENCELVLKGKGLQEGWTFLQKEIIKAQEQTAFLCCKMSQQGRRLAELDKKLLLILQGKKKEKKKKAVYLFLPHLHKLVKLDSMQSEIQANNEHYLIHHSLLNKQLM